jgi:hypothetical protein
MGKVSFAYKDFAKGGFGLQGGRYEVGEARTLVVQPQPNKQGEQSNPFTCVEFDVFKLGDDWKRTSDDVLQHQFAVAFTDVSKENEVEVMHLKCRPALAKGPDDDNPEDLGKDKEVLEMIGIEGNSMVADDGYKPWNQSPWALFVESLEAKAFKPDVSAQGFTGNYVGMKFSCEVKELTKPKNWKKEQPPSALVCTGIHTFPWDVKKDTKDTKGKKDEKGKDAGKDAAGKSNGSVDEVFQAIIQAFVKKHKGTTLAREEFRKQLGMVLMAEKSIGMKGAPALLKEWVTNDENFGALGDMLGFSVDGTDVKIA